MKRFGDDTAGFALAPEGDTLRVRAWGFWTPEVAGTLTKAVADACLPAKRMATLTLDVAAFKPQREEGQAAIRDLMVLLPKLGITHVSILASSSLTRLQLQRIMREYTSQGIVEFGS